MPDVCNYRYVQLSYLENIAVRTETTTSINMTTVAVFSTVQNDH